jgi:hypothetical protein
MTNASIIRSKDADVFKTESAPIVKYAQDLRITSAKIFEQASERLQIIKGIRNRIADKFDPIIKKAYEAHRDMVKIKNEIVRPLDNAEKSIKDQQVKYTILERQKQREKELKAIADAKKKQRELEAKAQKDAEKLEKKGEPEKAEQVVESVPQVPVKEVESRVPKVEGQHIRKTWKAKVIDENKVPRKYMIVDQKKLDKLAKATEGKEQVDGVEFYPVETVVARSR